MIFLKCPTTLNLLNKFAVKIKKMKRKGFSLVEVAIAMAVVAIMLTSFVAVFGPAQRNITRSLAQKDLNRLSDTLEYELSILRSGEEEEFTTAFDKAFTIISEYSADVGNGASNVLLYEYKGSLSLPPRSSEENPSIPASLDGSLVPFVLDNANREKSVSGRDFTMQTAVRIIGSDQDDEVGEELDLSSIGEGAVYLVRMRQLVDDGSGGLTPGEYGQILNPLSSNPDNNDSAGQAAASSEEYEGAYIAFQAEFYRMKSTAFNYIANGDWDEEDIGKPLLTKNLAVRR